MRSLQCPTLNPLLNPHVGGTLKISYKRSPALGVELLQGVNSYRSLIMSLLQYKYKNEVEVERRDIRDLTYEFYSSTSFFLVRFQVQAAKLRLKPLHQGTDKKKPLQCRNLSSIK